MSLSALQTVSHKRLRCLLAGARECRGFVQSGDGLQVLCPPIECSIYLLNSRLCSFTDSCGAIGALRRLYCKQCNTKLAAIREEGNTDRPVLICLGSIQDETIPAETAVDWRSRMIEWCKGEEAAWWKATPAIDKRSCSPKSVTVQGTCACKRCRFEADLFPGETQHCYCKLCRRLSGAVGQTWMPASKSRFIWTSKESLQFVRTTGHGKRHMCGNCGSVLTIVYDGQPDTIWPVAGALVDESLPMNISQHLYRSIHICKCLTHSPLEDKLLRQLVVGCSMMQQWYELPLDQLPRLKFPG